MSRGITFLLNTKISREIVENSNIVPTGSVLAFAGRVIPEGYLLCTGSEVSRTTYSKLFGVIGTTYGEGDGSSTFNLPDLTDRFIQGSDTAGTVKAAGLPGITGGFSINTYQSLQNTSTDFFSGAVTTKDNSTKTGRINVQEIVGGNLTGGSIYIDASLSSAVYGASDTVQPPALTMRYYIKY